MMDYEQMLEQMKALKAEKEVHLSNLKAALPSIARLRSELAKLRAHARKSSHLPSPEEIRARIDAIEFQIATSAYTPSREKALIKEAEKERKLLSEARAVFSQNASFEAKRREFAAADAVAHEAQSQLDLLRAKMQALHLEIVKAGDARREQGARERFHRAQQQVREKRRSEHRRESEPFMDKGEIEVSLLDAAVMSKEDRKKLREGGSPQGGA